MVVLKLQSMICPMVLPPVLPNFLTRVERVASAIPSGIINSDPEPSLSIRSSESTPGVGFATAASTRLLQMGSNGTHRRR